MEERKFMAKMIDSRRGGFYWQGSTPYLSVTETLKVISKPAIVYWFGREVYYAMLKDPTLTEKDAMASPYATSGRAKSRGTTIHSIVEAYKATGEQIDVVGDDFKGYATAFYDFMRDHKPLIIDQEKTVFDKEHRLAGTLDMYAKIGETPMVIDVKTGKDIYADFGLQLSAYAHMLRVEGKPVTSTAVLLLETGQDGKPTGKYKFQTMIEDFDAFLACKTMYQYINREKLIKVGYLAE